MAKLSKIKNLIRSKLFGKALILVYHRVADAGPDPFKLAVSPMNFMEQMALLKSNYHVISMDQLLNGIREKSISERAVVITFDDGYRDNLLNAKPVLEKFDMPATIFISTANLGKPFWWDELAGFMDELEENNKLKQYCIDNFSITNNDQNWYLAVYRRLKFLKPPARQSEFEKIRALSVRHNDLLNMRSMNTGEIKHITSRNITIGGHTVNHVPLSILSAEEQQREIFENKKQLEQIIQKPVLHFAFPFGQTKDISAGSINLLENAGYNSALCSSGGAVTYQSNTFMLPRIAVVNQPARQLHKQIKLWFQ